MQLQLERLTNTPRGFLVVSRRFPRTPPHSSHRFSPSGRPSFRFTIGKETLGPYARAHAQHTPEHTRTHAHTHAQAVVPHMASARSGRIVNVGSVVGYVPAPFAGVYAASKVGTRTVGVGGTGWGGTPYLDVLGGATDH
jgi:hypothetical protein